MNETIPDSQLWFATGGADYAQFRPQYPLSVPKFLTDVVADRKHAVDVGCGTGQLTQLLAAGFDHVTGVDPSKDQIRNAHRGENIVYHVAPAEHLPHDLNDVNLITVAQAAHWFDLPEFYRECERIAAPKAVIALISYGVLQPDTILKERFMHFYSDEIGQYWPPERHHVDEGYAGIYFPFSEIYSPEIEICQEWTLKSFMGYLSTWSAVKKAAGAGKSHLLAGFYKDLSQLWGDPETARAFTWPVKIRAGKL
ncbi:class I SAM-dependent methyltransferase [Escherichia coli]